MYANNCTTDVIDVAEFKNNDEIFLEVDFAEFFNLLRMIIPFSTKPQPPLSTKFISSDREFNSASFGTSHVLGSRGLDEK